jgi:hypothetical protein
MDFVGVLDRVDAFLTERGWRFALVGGVALAAYGIAGTDQDEVRGYFQKAGLLDKWGEIAHGRRSKS